MGPIYWLGSLTVERPLLDDNGLMLALSTPPAHLTRAVSPGAFRPCLTPPPDGEYGRGNASQNFRRVAIVLQ